MKLSSKINTNKKTSLTGCRRISQKYLPPFLFIIILLSTAHYAWSVFLTRTNYQNKSKQERKLILFSENALYFSFYDDLVNAPTLVKGLMLLTATDKIQYPDRVNVVREHSNSPEIILAAIFRFGRNLGFVIDPMDFYLRAVFLLCGLTVGMVFIISFIVNKSIISGLASFLLFITSWPYSTRAVSFPAQRENFTVPLLLLSLLVFYLLLNKFGSRKNYLIGIGVLILVQLLFWPFSLYTVLIAIIGIMAIESRPWSKPAREIVIVAVCLIIGVAILQGRGLTGGGGHVLNYFLYRLGFIAGDFHSMLYSCSGGFDGLNAFLIKFLTGNLLTILTVIGGFFLWQNKENRIWLAWGLGYGLMALTAYRFLVLAIPVWSVIAGEVVSRRHEKLLGGVFRWGWLVAMVCSLVFVSSSRLKDEAKIVSEGNPYAADLVNWIDNNTAHDSVFSASMSLTSTIRLVADRKITNNPFYEDESSREKNLEIYQVYNQRSEKDVYDLLRKNQTDYLVLEYGQCFLQSANGCFVADLFVNEPKDESLPTLCQVLSTDSPYFRGVYENPQYRVFKLLK